MKKIKTMLILALSLFIFQSNVSAATADNFMIESDALDYYNGDTVTLKVKMNKDLTLSSDETFYYIIYDENIFDFVSFEGIDNVLYDEEAQKLYLSSNINVNAEDIIGTLTLKVKDDAVNIKTDVEINYYSFYQTKDNEDSIELTVSPVITIDTTSDNSDEETTDTSSDFNPYIIGGLSVAAIGLISFIIYAIKKA